MTAAKTSPARVLVTRGGCLESEHTVDFALMDGAGSIVKAAGDIDRPVFPRSSIKALQALVLVEDGAADAFGLSAAHLALACASHSGEAQHVARAEEMLAAAGLQPTCLACGAQPPQRTRDRIALAERGERATALHNNCSGKHAGMLAACQHLGLDPAGYVRPDHPVQKRIAQLLTALSDTPHDAGNVAVDGCSIPTYAIPLRSLALAFSRFGSGETLSGDRAAAARRLIAACFEAPEMVAGTGRACTTIMREAKGRAFVKTGAEGVYAAVFPEEGLAAVLKVRDGAQRAAECAVASLVCDVLGRSREDGALGALASPTLTNWNGITVGTVRAAL